MGKAVHKLSFIKHMNFYFYCGYLNSVREIEFVSGNHLDHRVTCKRCLKKLKAGAK